MRKYCIFIAALAVALSPHLVFGLSSDEAEALAPLPAQEAPARLPDGYEALTPTEEKFIRESVRPALPTGRIAKVRFELTYAPASVTITPSNGYATVKLPLPEFYPDLPEVYPDLAGKRARVDSPAPAPSEFFGIVSVDSPCPTAEGTLAAAERGIGYAIFAAVWPLKEGGASKETFEVAIKAAMRTYNPLRLVLPVEKK
jgi:hypothetical protein